MKRYYVEEEDGKGSKRYISEKFEIKGMNKWNANKNG